MARERRFHPQFATDLISATSYYKDISDSLVQRFQSAVADRFEAISDRADSFGSVDGEFRGCMLLQFPYLILFRIEKEFVVLIGLFHVASDRSGWFCRVNE